MEYIAEEEIRGSINAAPHSFSPQPYPDDVSQVPFTDEEETAHRAAYGHEAKCLALSKLRRYLPCHYFDYICGSSTGA